MAVVRKRSSLKDGFYSLLAIFAAMVVFFPLYWAMSTSLRNPRDTFTVSDVGVPWLDFEPTLKNWIDQLSTEESVNALANSTIISVSATALALLLGLPAAYALARWRGCPSFVRDK